MRRETCVSLRCVSFDCWWSPRDNYGLRMAGIPDPLHTRPIYAPPAVVVRSQALHTALCKHACHCTLGWKVDGDRRGSNGGWKSRGQPQIAFGVMGPLDLSI